MRMILKINRRAREKEKNNKVCHRFSASRRGIAAENPSQMTRDFFIGKILKRCQRSNINKSHAIFHQDNKNKLQHNHSKHIYNSTHLELALI